MTPHHIHLQTTDSTMAYAKRAVLDSTIQTDTIITTDSQLSGKGRWGRNWHSPKGNLYYTRTFPENPRLTPVQYSQLGALSVLSTLHSLGASEVTIKWPNDIVCQGKKLSGILIERFSHNSTFWISTGIGINVQMNEQEVSQATSLASLLHHPLSIETVLNPLVAWHTYWLKKASEDLDSIKNEWKKALSWMKGITIQTHRKETVLSGTVQEFLDDGSLLLLLDTGLKETVMPEWIDYTQ